MLTYIKSASFGVPMRVSSDLWGASAANQVLTSIESASVGAHFEAPKRADLDQVSMLWGYLGTQSELT